MRPASGALVFASTCSVYGAAGDDWLDEDSATTPVSLYAETNLEAEAIAPRPPRRHRDRVRDPALRHRLRPGAAHALRPRRQPAHRPGAARRGDRGARRRAVAPAGPRRRRGPRGARSRSIIPTRPAACSTSAPTPSTCASPSSRSRIAGRFPGAAAHGQPDPRSAVLPRLVRSHRGRARLPRRADARIGHRRDRGLARRRSPELDHRAPRFSNVLRARGDAPRMSRSDEPRPTSPRRPARSPPTAARPVRATFLPVALPLGRRGREAGRARDARLRLDDDRAEGHRVRPAHRRRRRRRRTAWPSTRAPARSTWPWRAWGIGPGDEVITSTWTFVATANVVLHMRRAASCWSTSTRRSKNLDPEQVAPAITPRTKAIIAVDFAGQPADYDALRAAVRPPRPEAPGRRRPRLRRQLARPAGRLARRRHLLLVLRHQEHHHRRRRLPGQRRRRVRRAGPRSCRCTASRRTPGSAIRAPGSWYYEVTAPGFKYNLTDLAAAIGLAQLDRWPEFDARRQAIARRYDEAFTGMPEVATPWVDPERPPRPPPLHARARPRPPHRRPRALSRAAQGREHRHDGELHPRPQASLLPRRARLPRRGLPGRRARLSRASSRCRSIRA